MNQSNTLNRFLKYIDRTTLCFEKVTLQIVGFIPVLFAVRSGVCGGLLTYIHSSEGSVASYLLPTSEILRHIHPLLIFRTFNWAVVYQKCWNLSTRFCIIVYTYNLQWTVLISTAQKTFYTAGEAYKESDCRQSITTTRVGVCEKVYRKIDSSRARWMDFFLSIHWY